MSNTELNLLTKILQINLTILGVEESPDPFRVSLPQSSALLQGKKLQSLESDYSILSTIIQERFSIPNTCILEYASKAYKQVSDELDKSVYKSMRNILTILEVLKNTILENTSISLSSPQSFGSQFPSSYLKGIHISVFRIVHFLERNGSVAFFRIIIDYWNSHGNQELSTEIIKLLLIMIQVKVDQSTLLIDSTRSLVFVFMELIENKVIVLQNIQETIQNSFKNGQLMEKLSVLGKYFSISLLPRRESLMKIRFYTYPDRIREKLAEEVSEIKSKQLDENRTRYEYNKIVQKYSEIHTEYTNTLTNLFKVLLKLNNRLFMDWLKFSISENGMKLLISPPERLTSQYAHSSDGFCLNVLDVLLNFTEPFLKIGDPRLTKINKFFLANSNGLFILGNKQICTSISPEKILVGESGTTSEFYYYTVLMFHVGWHSLRKFREFLQRLLKNYEKGTSELEKSHVIYYTNLIFCYDTNLKNPIRNSKLLKFSIITLHLLIGWCSFTDSLPLPAPDPCLSHLPQFFIGDIVKFYSFLLDSNPSCFKSLSNEDLTDLLTYFTVILSSPSHFSNILHRAKLVKSIGLLFAHKFFTDSSPAVTANHFIKVYLLPALLEFFVDIEKSGTHNQFYEKFTYRHYCWLIFEVIWRIPHYQQQVNRLKSEQYFIRYINMILNDTIFLFDEGTAKLMIVKKYQDEIKASLNTPRSPKEEEEYKAREKENSKTEQLCSYNMQQTNEFTSMIYMISCWSPDIFLLEEFGNRTAAMLNSFLQKLNGPNCLKLKVGNPEKLKFEPAELLGKLVRIYTNIARNQEFVGCIASDERSFSLETFEKTERILRKKHFVNLDERERFFDLVSYLRIEVGNKCDIEFDDIPEEFLCGLTSDIMKNPVTLPSGTVVDRANIRRHLLTSGEDPFNRQPLNFEDLVEDIGLKQRIEIWIKEYKAKKRDN